MRARRAKNELTKRLQPVEAADGAGSATLPAPVTWHDGVAEHPLLYTPGRT